MIVSLMKKEFRQVLKALIINGKILYIRRARFNLLCLNHFSSPLLSFSSKKVVFSSQVLCEFVLFMHHFFREWL